MTDNGSCALVDTNVLVYAYDLDEPRKHSIAQGLVERLSNQARLVLINQVLTSFVGQ